MIGTRGVCVLLMGLSVFALYASESDAARPLGRDVDSLFKRNAWWSKKSSEFSSHPGGIFGDGSTKSESTLELLIGCYTEECVPELLLCGNTAQTEQLYVQCKIQHRACAIKCLHGQMR